MFKEVTSPSLGNLRELINLYLGLLTLAETEDVCYRINPDIQMHDHFTKIYRMIGRAIGKAIFERVPISLFFDRTFIKYLIGKPITLEDIQLFDKHVNPKINFYNFIIVL